MFTSTAYNSDKNSVGFFTNIIWNSFEQLQQKQNATIKMKIKQASIGHMQYNLIHSCLQTATAKKENKKKTRRKMTKENKNLKTGY